MFQRSILSLIAVGAASVALAQTTLQPNQNQSNQTNQAPKAPGQMSNANAEPTPPPQGGPGFTADPTSHQSDMTGGNLTWDKQFIVNIALRGMRQIDLAKVALEKTSNPNVKEYAAKVVEEQGQATGALKRIGGQRSIAIPAALDPKQQAEVDKISKLIGLEFDRAFARDQVRIHERSLRDFQREIKEGQDESVKTFATRVLPIVERHLQSARDLDKAEMSQK